MKEAAPATRRIPLDSSVLKLDADYAVYFIFLTNYFQLQRPRFDKIIWHVATQEWFISLIHKVLAEGRCAPQTVLLNK